MLELGCGGGRDSARIAERGFDLDATDGTPAMVGKTRERFAIAARPMRFDELDAVSAYDAVWAHACLIHVARADFAGVLAAIHRALRPGGWHFANFKLGDGEGRDPLGRLTNFPDEAWLEAGYCLAGFNSERYGRRRGRGRARLVRADAAKLKHAHARKPFSYTPADVRCCWHDRHSTPRPRLTGARTDCRIFLPLDRVTPGPSLARRPRRWERIGEGRGALRGPLGAASGRKTLSDR